MDVAAINACIFINANKGNSFVNVHYTTYRLLFVPKFNFSTGVYSQTHPPISGLAAFAILFFYHMPSVSSVEVACINFFFYIR